MLKSLTFLTLVVMLSASTLVAQKQKKIKEPIVEFKSSEIDFGDIEQGANGEREFHFTNKGKAPLIISNVSSTCGCTVPSRPEEPILPGKSGVIKVKYDTQRLGVFTKSIMVTSNATQPTYELKIKGNVKAKEGGAPVHDHAH
jgi:hypothetical protein